MTDMFNLDDDDAMDIDDLVIDMSDVSSASFDTLPAGWYHLAVTGSEIRRTQNANRLPANTPGINWEFTVQSGPYEGRKTWNNTWIHPNTLGFLKTLTIAAGLYTEETYPASFNLGEVREGMQGREVYCKIAVKTDEKYGEQNNHKGYRPMTANVKLVGEERASGASTSLLP